MLNEISGVNGSTWKMLFITRNLVLVSGMVIASSVRSIKLSLSVLRYIKFSNHSNHSNHANVYGVTIAYKYLLCLELRARLCPRTSS